MNNWKKRSDKFRRFSPGHSAAGFTLVEMLIAILVFMIIAGASISLANKHVPLVSAQQNQAGLNLVMRNAVAQMQIDIVNAGSGYYPGANIPAFPIGVTITNNIVTGTSNCYNSATFTYGQDCFDILNVITTDTTMSPSHPSDPGSSDNCHYTAQSSTLFVNASDGTATNQYAANFHKNDELLLIKSDGSQMTTVVLTQDGQPTGTGVKLNHNPGNLDGSDPNELFGIAVSADSNKLGTQFCPGDWVLRIKAVTYQVDASDPADPKLTRTVDGGNPDIIADQIIGFKVGAMTWNTTVGDDQANYSFNAAEKPPSQGCTDNCGYNSDWSLIRSVMVSFIGRTAPDYTNNFRNTFDSGPYKVQAISVVINPRNLSMSGQ